MPRIVGVDVPNDKRVLIALTYIHGIGLHTAKQILSMTGIDESMRAKNLTEEELSRLAGAIDKHCVVEGQLRRQVTLNITRLKSISSYRGLRHRRGLPVRGQRTRTNARVRKGHARRTVAKKRSVKALG